MDDNGRVSARTRLDKRAQATAEPYDLLDCLKLCWQRQQVAEVVLYCRVSTRGQRSHLADQQTALRTHCARLGIPVLACFSEATSGWQHDEQIALGQAIALARSEGPLVAVVAESTDRFVRHRDYQDNRHGAKGETAPCNADIEQLEHKAGGVKLATMLLPDLDADLVQKYQAARGNGFGICERALALELFEYGMSKKEVARTLRRPISTVRHWLAAAAKQ